MKKFIERFFPKHKVLVCSLLMDHEYEKVTQPYIYYWKYLFNKEFRKRQQRKMAALDEWNEECNRAIFKDLFGDQNGNVLYK
jgi:hypothetical protein